MKKTVVIGASTNPARYSHAAANMLSDRGYDMVPVGIKKGEVAGKPILDLREKPSIDNVHTITLYLGPQNQKEWYDYLIGLSPRRIIFNPGTENSELERMAVSKGIETLEACTLVMLSVGNF
jgi:hypothetical protein